MKHLISLLLFVCAVATTSAQAEATRYISDNLFTYMHTGPSNQYRIMGSIDAGSKVVLLDTNKSSGFSRVKDDKGRTGWVNSDFISTQMGLKERVPALEQELAEVKTKLAESITSNDSRNAGMKTTLDQRNQQITELEDRNSKLNEQLSTAQTEIRELRAKIDTQKDDL
ncbi:TIGR04211 family SH3 domain-containing protein, partial [Photobacterium damselae subsp. damselae]|nr:TIGR04211 family SH3 domain-containing protein [Photobacterium damselae subsp. damselae]